MARRPTTGHRRGDRSRRGDVGLVEFSTRVRFCHPLARSAVYQAANADQRRTAHRVLAEVTDPVSDPDKRVGRTLAAVAAKLEAGDTDAAADLLTTVGTGGLDELRHAEVDLLRGQIAFVRHGDANGPSFILRAARRLSTVDPGRARDCFLDALEMGLVVGRPGGVMDLVLDAAQSAPPAPGPPDILNALVVLTTDGHRAAVPLLRTVLSDGDGALWTRHPALATILAAELWDADLHGMITGWLVKTGRESGSPLTLRLGLAQVASTAVQTGDLGRAMEAIAEEEAIADAVGAAPFRYPRLHLAAMRGRRAEALELIATATAEATVRGNGQLIANAHWAAAVVHNGLADYPAALAAARRATEHGDLFLTGIALPELVEAAVRCGEHDAARSALEPLTERTGASGTAWGLGVAAYARALVTGDEDDYRDSLEHLAESPAAPSLARAHLLYGEWLRREGRRRDAREHLRTAHNMASDMGLEAFARRAADELRATGEQARARSAHTSDQLTMQEVHIARLVTTGATSKETAARLFLSPRTIDAHLRNIFRKLDITSRRQLKDLPDLH